MDELFFLFPGWVGGLFFPFPGWVGGFFSIHDRLEPTHRNHKTNIPGDSRGGKARTLPRKALPDSTDTPPPLGKISEGEN